MAVSKGHASSDSSSVGGEEAMARNAGKGQAALLIAALTCLQLDSTSTHHLAPVTHPP